MKAVINKAKQNFIKQIYSHKKIYSTVLGLYHIAQHPFDFFKTKNIIHKDFVEIEISEYKNIFFGYYDISAFNPKNEDLILIHGTNHNLYKEYIDLNTPCDIIVYSISTKSYEIAGSSNLWNWQQGCRLQWLDDENIIYNNFERKRYVSKIYNVRTKKTKTVNIPIQSCFKNKFFISIDYSKLTKLKSEYGYNKESFNNEKDKIIHYDICNKKKSIIIDLQSIIYKYSIDCDIYQASFNHVLISPDGKNLIFLLRIIKNNTREDYLFRYSLNEQNEFLLIKNMIISHATWISNNKFIIWLSSNNNSGYYEYDISNNELISIYKTKRDGHPSMSGNKLITDTYPNSKFRQNLYEIDTTYNKTTEIASIYHPPFIIVDNRCDLHPSLAQSHNKIQVDIIKNFRRKILIIDK